MFKTNFWLSNETSLEKIGRDLFVSRFYTKTEQKAEKIPIFKVIKTKKSAHSIKNTKN
jgi:truncated hemoglobin YjbI